MATTQIGFANISGLAADTKPTTGIGAGSTFYETDTKKSFIYDGTAWNETGGSGALFQFNYQWKLAVDASPPTHYMSRDNAVTASITKLYVNKVDATGHDMSLFLSEITAGDDLTLHDHNDADIYIVFTASAAATLTGNAFTIPVTFVKQNGHDFTDNESVNIHWVSESSGGASEKGGIAHSISTDYVVGDIVSEAGKVYSCKTTHTAKVFTVGDWDEVSTGLEELDINPIVGFSGTPQGSGIFIIDLSYGDQTQRFTSGRSIISFGGTSPEATGTISMAMYQSLGTFLVTSATILPDHTRIRLASTPLPPKTKSWKFKSNPTTAEKARNINLMPTGDPTQENVIEVEGVKYKSYTGVEIAALVHSTLGTFLFNSTTNSLVQCVDASPGENVWDFVVTKNEIVRQDIPPVPPDVSGIPTQTEVQAILDYSKEISKALSAANVFIPLLPTLVCSIHATLDSFDFETDAGEEFIVKQSGISQVLTGNGTTPVHVTMTNGTAPIRITLTGNNTYFKMKSDVWRSITLESVEGLFTLEESFNNLSTLVHFESYGKLSGITNFNKTWMGCGKLASFDAVGFTDGVTFSSTWRNCSSLTSLPVLDTSSGTDFSSTWSNCSSLTSLPVLDTSSGTDFGAAWFMCSSLTSLPVLDTSSGTDFSSTWSNCTHFVCFVGTLNFIKLVVGRNTFGNSPLLTAPTPTGTHIRAGDDATAGTWTNPNPCP